MLNTKYKRASLWASRIPNHTLKYRLDQSCDSLKKKIIKKLSIHPLATHFDQPQRTREYSLRRSNSIQHIRFRTNLSSKSFFKFFNS